MSVVKTFKGEIDYICNQLKTGNKKKWAARYSEFRPSLRSIRVKLYYFYGDHDKFNKVCTKSGYEHEITNKTGITCAIFRIPIYGEVK